MVDPPNTPPAQPGAWGARGRAVKERIYSAAAVVSVLAVLALAVWNMYAWFTYPCDAWKHGYLSTGYAPGRCLT